VLARSVGERVLEVALGQAPGHERLELPKGFVLPGEDPADGILCVLQTETAFRPSEPGAVIVEESTFDPRQTDHAWVETRVHLFFDDGGELPDLFAAGGDFETFQWWPLDAKTINRMSSAQAVFVRAAVERLSTAGRIDAAVARYLLARSG
jgi:ADP-ribose pyrophosphatase YjhB (NUDIX family)